MILKEQNYDKSYYRGRNSNYIFWYGNLGSRIFWLRRMKLLKRFVSGGKLLDLGCAFGFFLKFLEKQFDVYGVDISDYSVKRAKRILSKPDQVKTFDIRKSLPFNEKFDAVTAFDIMEHIADPLPVFEVLYSALERHGYLYMEVPLSDTFINRDIGHQYRPLEEWADILKRARFGSRFVQTYYTIGLRAVMIPSQKSINYCSIIAHKLDY